MSSETPDFGPEFRETLDQLLVWRRDVRRFRTDPIDAEALEAALRAFDLAPSVGNSQPWRLVLVESRKVRAVVRESFTRCNAEAFAATTPDKRDLYARLKLAGLDDAPIHLAVYCDVRPEQGHGLGWRTMPETLAYSTAGAVAMFSLTARAHDIGVGWVSILEPDVLAEALDLPRHWRLIAYLCVGYPEKEDDVPELERAGWQSRCGDRPILQR
ncbi:Nitroreductase [Fulvimarina pelagi HTCC2506]|uniref:Nitroreductase n=1 Tax=Fulvimarina pelagi HTCC2506 TaxID=314231 RepID=Q0G7W9_9HYPH|nr:5,6-dimethylbenzimidazole synthase [Fulvimarina pelagi]EAU42245.1 Nitroreductase [Fulvimarina pelagi HTCC2506]